MRYPVQGIRHLFVLSLLLLLFMPCLSCLAAGKKNVIAAFSKKRFWGLNTNDAKIALEMWTKVLARKKPNNYIVKSAIFDDISDLLKEFRKGEIQFVGIETLEYMRMKEKNLLEPLIVGVKRGKILEEYALIVNQDSDIRELKQLKEKKILIDTGGKGEIGRIWLDTMLLRQGLQVSSKFFSSSSEVKEPSSAIMPVYFKKLDACVVTTDSLATMEELNPKVGKKLRILARSPGFLINVLFFRKDADEEVKKVMLDSALTLHSDPEGQQVLLLFRLDRLETYRPSYMEPVNALFRDYNSLRKGK